jgi:hypothetical protein
MAPTAADQQRVRRAVQQVVLAGEAAGVAAVAARGSPAAIRPSTRPWAHLFPRAVSGVLVAVAVAVAVGAAGYWAGRRAGLREARMAMPGDGFWSLPSREPAAAETGAPPRVELKRRPLPEKDDGFAAGTVRRRRQTTRPADGGPPASAAASLQKELTALRSVERALRDGQPGLAMALLQELERTVPNGRMGEERLATSIIARCTLGDAPFGVNLAEDFASRYSESVYLERVEQACAYNHRAGSSER